MSRRRKDEQIMKKAMKKMMALIISLTLIASISACGTEKTSDGKTYTVGICNYVDDASLNQIVANIESQLNKVSDERSVDIEIKTENCMADPSILEQIISGFIADKVDLMIGVATPVAMQMQAMTEDSDIPVIYAAVSDPVGAGLCGEDGTSGANICGTSDYFDTSKLFDLIFAIDPETDKIGLLYDVGQDSSTSAIASAREYLEGKGIEYVEKNGTTSDEVVLAAQSLVAEGVDAVFTPSDNTIMKAELAIYEIFSEAGVLHYGGADSFALNGAFLGYGVDYANLGVETANMAIEVLLDGADIGAMKYGTFDNGIATVNTDVCKSTGKDYNEISETISPYCTAVQSIVTADSFDDLE